MSRDNTKASGSAPGSDGGAAPDGAGESDAAAHPDKPECFGQLEMVFPRGADGLRHSPPLCMACVFKTECLRTAMQQPEGLEVESERVDRAYESRTINFFQRWSKKKQLAKEKDRKKSR